MKFLLYKIVNPLNPEQFAWGWAFVDSNGNRGPSAQGLDTAQDAGTNLEEFLTTLFVDPEGVTIEVQE